ncbi:MAG: RNA polymerase sporulation sigma factor SigK [Lachnospiraceae bacterium]|nr:RNA polymerase sporulation sigma factor SigK [Lachnospiraceae bacterium]
MKTFEQPLSAKEETLYLEAMNSEDLEAAHRARQILIERNLRLVAHVSKKYMGCGEDMEDLISIGTIGLIKAVNTFKAEKGSRLATYAARCIDNELLMMFRARKKVTREVSLYEPIGTDKEGNEINLIDVCEQEQRDIVDDMDMMAKLKCLSHLIEEKLDHREREIIKLRYGMSGNSFTGEEMTQRDIGKMLGISRSYVSRIEKKALGKLRTGLEEQKLC